MDGFQVLEFLGENNLHERIRTIILTNHDEPENEVKGLQLGAVDFVRKPVDAEVLKARVMVHGFHIRKQRELAWNLYKKEITYDQIFNQVPVGIAISFNHDALERNDNQYFLINPALEKILGRSRNELMRLGWAAITHPDDVEENLRCTTCSSVEKSTTTRWTSAMSGPTVPSCGYTCSFPHLSCPKRHSSTTSPL
jgi:CheY-like chemotaxis protein